MFQNHSSLGISLDQLPRGEERKQVTLYRKSLNPAQLLDAEIRESIYEALWQDDVLRAIEYYDIDVHVTNKTVHLNGYIISESHQQRIESAVLTVVPDLTCVENHFVLDDRLALQVTRSLGELEHKHDCKFFASALHGMISLNGMVDAEDVKQLAEQCVIRNLDVRGVINNVYVSGDRPSLSAQKHLQPLIGAVIYFVDGIFGLIKQVVINPNNQCVVQMVVQGQFSYRQDLRLLTSRIDRTLERAIVVSVNLVRYLTDNAGYLTIKSAETTRYKDFNPLYFTTPKANWVPPHPYSAHDVLFNVDPSTVTVT